MSHTRETTLFIDFFKNASIMPLGLFLVIFYKIMLCFVYSLELPH